LRRVLRIRIPSGGHGLPHVGPHPPFVSYRASNVLRITCKALPAPRARAYLAGALSG
jgi:hypothetical protein